MAEDDADKARVERLLEQILESGDSAEDACRPFPELLPKIRAALLRLRELEQEVSDLFPPSDAGDLQQSELLLADDLPVVPGLWTGRLPPRPL